MKEPTRAQVAAFHDAMAKGSRSSTKEPGARFALMSIVKAPLVSMEGRQSGNWAEQDDVARLANRILNNQAHIATGLVVLLDALVYKVPKEEE